MRSVHWLTLEAIRMVMAAPWRAGGGRRPPPGDTRGLGHPGERRGGGKDAGRRVDEHRDYGQASRQSRQRADGRRRADELLDVTGWRPRREIEGGAGGG